MSKATLTIRFNSSYVLIGTTSDRLGTGAARPPAPRLSILYCQGVGCQQYWQLGRSHLGLCPSGSITLCYSLVLRRRNDHSSRLILIDRSEKIPTLILLSNGKIMGANSAGSCSFRYTVVYFFKGSIIQYSRTPELR